MENFHVFVNCPLLHNTSCRNYSVYTCYEMASRLPYYWRTCR